MGIKVVSLAVHEEEARDGNFGRQEGAGDCLARDGKPNSILVDIRRVAQPILTVNLVMAPTPSIRPSSMFRSSRSAFCSTYIAMRALVSHMTHLCDTCITGCGWVR